MKKLKKSQNKNIFIVEYQIGFSNFFFKEIESFQPREGNTEYEKLFEGVLLLECRPEILEKSSFVKRIAEVVITFDNFNELDALDPSYGQFYVRIRDSSDCHSTPDERLLGEKLGAKGRVNFKNPDNIFIAYHVKNIWYLGRQIYQASYEKLQTRKAGMRPFFSPTSMDPRFARFCINVADVPEGGMIMDPFCGTGGMLIEAGLLKYNVVGIDISQEMVLGTRLNLKFFGIHDYVVTRANFLEYSNSLKVDAIVTDLPYGRSSSRAGIETAELFSKLPQKMYQVLKDDGCLILVTNTTEFIHNFDNLFTILFTLPLTIHRSLTRYYIKMKKNIKD